MSLENYAELLSHEFKVFNHLNEDRHSTNSMIQSQKLKVSSLFKIILEYLNNIKDTSNNTLPNDNFVKVLVKIFPWADYFKNHKDACEIIKLLLQWDRDQVLKFGFLTSSFNILLEQYYIALYKTDVQASKFSILMDTFFPSISIFLPHSKFSKCGYKYSADEMFNDFTAIKDKVFIIIRALFPTIYRMCKLPNCLPAYLNIFSRMIFWANALKVLDTYCDVQELKAMARIMAVKRFNLSHVIFGSKVTYILMDGYQRFLMEKRAGSSDYYLVSKLYLKRHSENKMYDGITDFNSMPEFVNKLILEDWIITSFDSQTLVHLLIPHQESDVQSDLKVSYYRLKMFVAQILDLMILKGQIVATPDRILMFESFISGVINCLEMLDKDIFCDTFFSFVIHDMPSLRYFSKIPRALNNVSLGIFETPSFDRVLCPIMLNENTITKVLRLLSILYEVNENWGVLFGFLSTERLIDRKNFICHRLNNKIVELLGKKKLTKLKHCILYSNLRQYMFLVPFATRYRLKQYFITNHSNHRLPSADENQLITVPREKIIDFIINNSKQFHFKVSFNNKIHFKGELARGLGPTKEFYTEVSHDSQRSDLDLWVRNNIVKSNGVVYIDSPRGVFPSPRPSKYPKSKEALNCLGSIMGRSLIDEINLDLNFSKACYQRIFGGYPDHQNLYLSDIIDVMPNIYPFVSSLVDALRMKLIIEMKESLTIEERSKAISSIRCNDASFEDLCINFTLPGYEDIEMKDGGKNTLLSIKNVEEYLKLLVWWFLYKGTMRSFAYLKTGLYQVITDTSGIKGIELFYPDEMEQIFCGIKSEEWTVDYLKKSCKLEDGLTFETPVVQHLFEVLSSLSPSEQKEFLIFVTSSPRLPIGGLRYLTPKLTIKRRGTNYNPDSYLPSSSTCFNTLVITEYTNPTALKEKLFTAIKEGLRSFQFV